MLVDGGLLVGRRSAGTIISLGSKKTTERRMPPSFSVESSRQTSRSSLAFDSIFGGRAGMARDDSVHVWGCMVAVYLVPHLAVFDGERPWYQTCICIHLVPLFFL